jgi:CubicO group peptidase (beta-lactamase class C family)
MIRKIGLIVFLLALNQQHTFSQKISEAKLDTLIRETKKHHSSALIIYQDGKLITEKYFIRKQKANLMSCTKSIVSLAIGKLFSDGKITSLDNPVYNYFPQWETDSIKRLISIKHLLNHTSGLHTNGNAIEIYKSDNFIKYALNSTQDFQPGTAFFYNNNAVNLLCGIVEKITGQKIDNFVKQEIFTPIGISEFEWKKDKAGNPQGMAQLYMYPKDFALLGVFVLNKGKWNDKQIISEKWFQISMQPSQTFNKSCGMLWWLKYSSNLVIIDDAQISKLKNAGVPNNILEKCELLKGIYKNFKDEKKMLEKVFGIKWLSIYRKEFNTRHVYPERIEYIDPVIGYFAEGDWGNYLVIYPDKKLVAIRMHKFTIGNIIPFVFSSKKEKHYFINFEKLVYKLVP